MRHKQDDKTRHLGCCLVLLLVCFAPKFATAQEDGRKLSASLRLGLEYDDNAYRIGGEETQGDALTRYIGSIEASMPSSRSGRIRLTINHGGTIFMRESDADTFLTQAALYYGHNFSPWLSAGMSLDIKDRMERVSRFDYTSGGASANLIARLSPVQAVATGGWRYFAFKPNDTSSSQGPFGGLSMYASIVDGLRLSLGYTIFDRRFRAPRFALVESMPSPILEQTDELREDYFHVARVGATWRGPAIVELSYVLSSNRSNSHGQDLWRHHLDATLTAPIFFDLLFSTHLQLQRTSYDDFINADANFIVDEDNRNSVVFSLSRPLWEQWDVEVRYSLYLQEFGVGSEYSRQTVMFALGYAYDR